MTHYKPCSRSTTHPTYEPYNIAIVLTMTFLSYAMGQVGKHNPFAYLNPAYRMVIAGTDGRDYDSVDGANHLDKMIAQRLKEEQSVSVADGYGEGQYAQDEYEHGEGEGYRSRIRSKVFN